MTVGNFVPELWVGLEDSEENIGTWQDEGEWDDPSVEYPLMGRFHNLWKVCALIVGLGILGMAVARLMALT